MERGGSRPERMIRPQPHHVFSSSWQRTVLFNFPRLAGNIQNEMRPEFLSPHPPVHDPKLIRELFHDRETEIAHVVNYLGPRNDHRGILAIYGETRAGKSHLALRAAQELPHGKRGYFHVYVNANQRITTKTVLWDAFDQLSNAVLLLEGNDPLIALARQWIAEIDEFHRSNVPTVTIRTQRGEAEEAGKSVKVKGEGSIGSTILGFIKAKVGFGIERERSVSGRQSQEEEITITLSAPSEDHLAEIIGFLGSVLAQLRCCQRVLLLVDDVDLLSSDTNAPKLEADIVIDALRKIASLEAFTVVATVREDFYGRKGKDFRNLCFVHRFPEEKAILEIYNTHVHKLNSGISPYTPEAASYLAGASGGLIGSFFDECERMRQYFIGVGTEWALERVLDFYRSEALRLAGAELRPVISAIEAAASMGRATLGSDIFNQFGISSDAIKSSPLIGRVLNPPRYQDLFEVNPFVFGAFKKARGEDQQ